MARVTHWYIAKLAKKFAAEAYEGRASVNWFYKMHPSRELYVAGHYEYFIRYARETMAQMLGRKLSEDPEVDAKMKEDIFEILQQDRSLPAGDTSVQQRGSVLRYQARTH